MKIPINVKEKIATYFRNEEDVKKGNRILLIKGNSIEVVESVPNIDVHWYGENSVIKYIRIFA